MSGACRLTKSYCRQTAPPTRPSFALYNYYDTGSSNWCCAVKSTNRWTIRWPLRYAPPPPDNCRLYAHAIPLWLLSYSRFFPNLYPIVIQSWNLWQFQLCPINLKFLYGIPILSKLVYGWSATLHPDTSVPWPQWSLLVLRAVRRQRNALYVILTIFER